MLELTCLTDAKPAFVPIADWRQEGLGRHFSKADGSVIVPEVLRPYMGGLEIIIGK
ncbi:MAG: hypothetical protein WCS37_04350 [Chloroflexota bacterium]|nr:hypothetical protein [Chloroflexota bacterium]